MAYLTLAQLEQIGFKSLGRDVRVSDRAAIYNADQIELGDFARIDDFCVVSGRVVFGRNVFLGVHGNIAGGTTGVFIDDFAGISYGAQIFAQSDDYSGLSMTGPSIPVRFRNEIKKPIHIHRHVAVGAGSIIFPGVTLAEGTAVGATSLVIKSTQPWSVYCGSPAKRIKSRSRNILELEKQFLAEEG